MALEINIEQTRIKARGDMLPVFASTLSMRLEGRKHWPDHDQIVCERSQHNLNVLLEIEPTAIVHEPRSDIAIAFDENELAPDPIPQFQFKPHSFQLENFDKFKTLPQFAIFSEQGTGKTKVAIDIMCFRFLKKMISGVIVLSSPKGVHEQWITEQLPKHLWPNVETLTFIWANKKPPEWVTKRPPLNELQIISGNIDMVKSATGAPLLKAFARKHGKKLLVLVDESDSIKEISTKRSVKLRDLVQNVTQQRAIMTGTPIAKDLTDEWSQFYFLNPNIIGHKYKTTFRAEYCIMGGFENRAVVGHRNVEKFKKLTAPYIFRATKADLNLPPKIYDAVHFDLTEDQIRMIRDIKKQFFATIDPTNEAVAVKNGATALLRIQQISNGFAVDENGEMHWLEKNPRMEALLDLRRQIIGPCITWCRFKSDVRSLHEQLPNAAVIWGEEPKQDSRTKAKQDFISGKTENLIATPGAGGRGLDGFQEICSYAIYYSNSFNAVERWQSEDRIDRIGMKGSATYFDLIANKSADKKILANLKKKKGLSQWVLDDIKEIMGEIP